MGFHTPKDAWHRKLLFRIASLQGHWLSHKKLLDRFEDGNVCCGGGGEMETEARIHVIRG